MTDNLLIVADSDRDADMLYAVGMFVPDPFIYLRLRGKCHVVMNDLEIDRARQEARHCKIISWSQCVKQLEREGQRKFSTARIIRFILKQKRITKLAVPSNFPLGLAEELRELKIKIKCKRGAFFPGARAQVRRGSETHQRRAHDGRSRIGRRHPGPEKLKGRAQSQIDLPEQPAHLGETARHH